MLYRSPDSIQLKWMASQWEVQIEIILGNEWWHVQKRFSEPHEHSNELFSNEIFLQQLYQSNTIAIKCGIFFLFNLIKLLSRLIISSRTLLIITSTNINGFGCSDCFWTSKEISSLFRPQFPRMFVYFLMHTLKYSLEISGSLGFLDLKKKMKYFFGQLEISVLENKIKNHSLKAKAGDMNLIRDWKWLDWTDLLD